MNPEAAKMMRRFGCCDLIPLHYGAFYGKYARNDEVAVFVITKQLDAAEINVIIPPEDVAVIFI